MGKPGRDGAPSSVKPGYSATRQEVRLGGPPTRAPWGGYHLARPGGPRGRKASSTRRIKPQTSNLALLRTLAAPGIGLSSLGWCALGLLYWCVARCKHGVFTGGWDVGLGRGDGVLQLEHLLGHEAKHFLGLLQGVGRVRGPVEEPVPGACSVAAHVGRVVGFASVSTLGCVPGGGGPLAPPAPSRGRSASVPRLPLGCGGRVRRVASCSLRVVGAGLCRRGRVPLPV